MNRPPVLCLPGTLCTPAIFDQQVKALADHAPAIEVLRLTTQNSISQMADLAIARIPPQSGAAIIGFSMGGMVAMEIARKAPRLVKKLALLNTNCRTNHAGRQSARTMHLDLVRQMGIEPVIRQYYLPQYLYKPGHDAEALIVRMAAELGVGCFDAQSEALATRPDLKSALAAIDCPTLVLGATQDRLCTPDMQYEMHQLLKNSELVLLEACGHFSMLEQPSLVNEALLRWYKNA